MPNRTATRNPSRVSLAYARALDDHLRARGRDGAAVLHAANLPALPLSRDHDFSSSVPISKLGVALGLAKRELDDDLLGLHLGRDFSSARCGVVGDMVRHSENLASGLLRVQAIWSSINTYCTLGVRVDRGSADITWECATERPSPDFEDFMVASFVAIARELSGVAFAVTGTYLRRPPPKDSRSHDAFFGCSVRFRQPICMLRMPTSGFLLPTKQADVRLAQRAERKVSEALASSKECPQTVFLDSVKAALETCVPRGIPTVESVADELRISPRALRARLKASGITFRVLRDGVLRTMALHYLRLSDLSLDDVAEKTGFSEQSAFSRAFKNWTGTTPGAFRTSYLDPGKRAVEPSRND